MTDLMQAPYPEWFKQYEEFADPTKLRFKMAADEQTYVAIIPFLFTTAIIVGNVNNSSFYKDRWCYEVADEAVMAFEAWDGLTGEPYGWHRHPNTGRRRPLGKPEDEYVEP